MNGNVIRLIECSGKTQTEVADVLGMSPSNLSRMLKNSDIKYSKIIKIAEVLNLMPEQVLRAINDTDYCTRLCDEISGTENQPERPKQKEEPTAITSPTVDIISKQTTPNKTSVPSNNIVMIDSNAAVIWPLHINDTAYYKELPSFTMPGNKFKNGSFVCLQIEGDNMYPVMHNADWVIGKELKIEDLQNGAVFILVTENAVKCQRLYYQKGNDYITCRSDNKIYEDYTVPLKAILRIYSCMMKLSSTFQES